MEHHRSSFYIKIYLIYLITTSHVQASDAFISSNNATVDTLYCDDTVSGYLKQSETARYEFIPTRDVYFDGCSSKLDISFEVMQSNNHWVATNDNPNPCESSGSFLTFSYDPSYDGSYYVLIKSHNELDYGNYSFTYICDAKAGSHKAPEVSRYSVIALSMSGLIIFVGILVLIEYRQGRYRFFFQNENHIDIETKEISLKESATDRDIVEKETNVQVPTATNTPNSPRHDHDHDQESDGDKADEGDEDITITHTQTYTNTTKDCDEQLLEIAMGSIISNDEHNVRNTAVECDNGHEMSTAL